MDEMVLRQRVCDIARQLWQRGLMVADDGLISVEIHRRRFLVTPPGVRRAELAPRSLLVTDLTGKGPALQGLLPDAQWLPHRVVYQTRDDGVLRTREPHGPDDAPAVRATILSRPPMLSALVRRMTGAGAIDIGDEVLPVASSTDEASLAKVFSRGNAAALPGSGILVVGSTLDAALNLLERLELAATIELAVWRGE